MIKEHKIILELIIGHSLNNHITQPAKYFNQKTMTSIWIVR